MLCLRIGHGEGHRRRIERADDVHGGDRFDAEQKLQLGAGLLEIQLGVVVVRLELRQLQIDPFEVRARDISGIEPRPGSGPPSSIVGQVLLRDYERGFGEQHLRKGLADGEHKLSLLIPILALGLVRGRGCALQTPATFLSALEEPGDVGGVEVGVAAVVVDLRKIDALSQRGERRILAQTGGDLRRLHWQ